MRRSVALDRVLKGLAIILTGFMALIVVDYVKVHYVWGPVAVGILALVLAMGFWFFVGRKRGYRRPPIVPPPPTNISGNIPSSGSNGGGCDSGGGDVGGGCNGGGGGS